MGTCVVLASQQRRYASGTPRHPIHLRGTSEVTTESECERVSGDSASGHCVLPGGVVTLHVSFAHRPCYRTWCFARGVGVWPSSVRGHTSGGSLDATRRVKSEAGYVFGLGGQEATVVGDGEHARPRWHC
jgi:hypothetical protein